MKICIFIQILFSSLFCYAQVCATKSPLSNPNERLIVNLNQDGTQNIWSDSDKEALTFCIDDNFRNYKTTIKNALEYGMEQWELVANVRFIYLPEEDQRCKNNNSTVTFRVNMLYSKRVPYLAKAFFPYSPQSKRRVVFRKDLVAGDQKKLYGVVLHELGHVLGFRHEHIHPDNKSKCKEKAPFEPITDYDAKSIMIYPRCDAETLGYELSEIDKIGATTLYPFN